MTPYSRWLRPSRRWLDFDRFTNRSVQATHSSTTCSSVSISGMATWPTRSWNVGWARHYPSTYFFVTDGGDQPRQFDGVTDSNSRINTYSFIAVPITSSTG